ncbi:FAD:protein FMN transferase [candidate division NPL-UPA2 bacterium]|nr:FAD:protein FMN transferase [candidate division NPL-UPA2 bacterium]
MLRLEAGFSLESSALICSEGVFLFMKKLLLAIGFGLLLFGCQEAGAAPEHRTLRETRFLLGTTVEITIKGEEEARARQAIHHAFREIEKIHNLMNPFCEDSELSRLNREGAEGPVELGPDTFRVIQKSLRLSELSQGAFDITIAPLLRLWDAARKRGQLPGREELQKTLALVNYQNILFDEEKRTVKFREKGMSLNLGGIAKGYAVDKAVEKLRYWGIERAIVNAGGDIYLLGRPWERDFWVIGLKHPRRRGAILGTIKARDEAMVTSGDYEDYFILDGQRFSHLLDPRKGRPVEGVLSVTVLAENTLKADGLSTAIFVLGPKKGLELANRLAGVETIIVSEDAQGEMVITTTEGLKERFYLR